MDGLEETSTFPQWAKLLRQAFIAEGNASGSRQDWRGRGGGQRPGLTADLDGG